MKTVHIGQPLEYEGDVFIVRSQEMCRVHGAEEEPTVSGTSEDGVVIYYRVPLANCHEI